MLKLESICENSNTQFSVANEGSAIIWRVLTDEATCWCSQAISLPHLRTSLSQCWSRLSRDSIWLTSKYGLHHTSPTNQRSTKISPEMKERVASHFCFALVCFSLVSFLWSTKISLIGEEVEKIFFYTKLLKCKIGSNIIMQTKSINLSSFFEERFGLISFDLCTTRK